MASGAPSASWIAQVQAQPWYSGVASAFNNAGVPTDIWLSTLYSENASLNPAAAVNDPDQSGGAGTSYGLFQLRQPGAGSPYSTAQLTDPVQNATIAAGIMAQDIRNAAASTPNGMLQAISVTWPGSWTAAQQQNRPTVLAGIDQLYGQDPNATDNTDASAGGVLQRFGQWLQNPLSQVNADPTQPADSGSYSIWDFLGWQPTATQKQYFWLLVIALLGLVIAIALIRSNDSPTSEDEPQPKQSPPIVVTAGKDAAQAAEVAA